MLFYVLYKLKKNQYKYKVLHSKYFVLPLSLNTLVYEGYQELEISVLCVT